MPTDIGREPAEQHRVQRTARDSPSPAAVLGRIPTGENISAIAGPSLNDPRLNGRGNMPVRIAMMRQMQQTYGNRAVQRFLHGQVQAAVPIQRQVVIQRQTAGSDDCKKLMTDKDWTGKGAVDKGGYDTGNYYKDVAAKIIEAAEKRGVAFDKALYMAAQARAEQGETDPAKTRYRRFNIQVTEKVVKETQGRFTKTPPDVVHTTKDGRKYKWLQTIEQGEACKKIKSPIEKDGFCHPAAPFYFYDSMEEATYHYLDEMEKKGSFGSKGASDILWDKTPAAKKAGIVEFGNALKKGGYGTDLNYVPKLCESYNVVVKKVKEALGKAIETKKECKKSNEEKIKELEGDDGKGGKLAEAKKELEDIRAKIDSDKSYKRTSSVSAEEMQAVKKVRQLEYELNERKEELKKIEEMIKTLEERLKGLPENAIKCPPEVKVPGKA